jgi:acyl-CoA synthetase (AMP-forming)/AMP-acid ligase II
VVDPRRSLTFADVLREHGRSWPEQTAVVDGDVRLTYGELDRRASRLANALRGAGIGEGERVLWLGQNSFRVLEALLAAAKLGAMFCPTNWRQSAEELAFVIDDIDARVVLWQEEEIGDAVRDARAASASSALWLRHDTSPRDDGSYEGFVASGADDDPEIDVDPAAPLLIIYTAAFGGRPNGAMLSHAALVSQGLVMGQLSEVDGGYVYLNSGPLFHIGTFMTTLATFVAAGTNVFTRRVDAEELCRLIEAERCTGAFILGPTFDQIIEVNRDRRYDLTSLRSFGGRPEWDAMTSRDTSPWARNPGGYGQSEAVGMLTFNTLAPSDAIGSHGRTSPVVQLRLVDEDGVEVPDGETGEIVVRGLTVMNGYWNRTEENERRRRGGWHHTNDLGRREADGTITFVGPKTRMIKSAAENIYPAEVEACIAAHPAVAECAIIGVPDPQWTQSVKAVVVLDDGATATATADEIIEHCRSRIASYKKPRTVEFVEKLPRDGWVVDYDALDERFGGGGYPGGRNRSA